MSSKDRQILILSALRPYLLLLGFVLIFFHKMVFTDLILARGDTFLYFYPNWEFASRAFNRGEVPLWNPYLFMGAPFMANSQVGFFYPLNWPIWVLFDVPTGVKASIVAHLFIACSGLYTLARKGLQYSEIGALFAAVTFGLGGYLTAQVEHVNQLQGLAWLPWLLFVVHKRQIGWPGRLLLICLLFGLQFSAGHTQSLFISGVAAGLWLLGAEVGSVNRQNWSAMAISLVGRLALLAAGGLLALGLVAIQLLPTLELTGLSSRQGGLSINEVLSFSWHPLLVGHALLPLFNQSIFTEYVAFVSVTALVLAIWGMRPLVDRAQWENPNSQLREDLPRILPVVILLLAGLFLAFGRFNLVSNLYGRLPGFDLFRVPARWLILYGLGIGLMGGYGFDQFRLQREEIKLKTLWIPVAAVLGLLAWSFVARLGLRVVPIGQESPYFPISVVSLFIILPELILIFWLLAYGKHVRWSSALIFLLSATSLFLGSRALPYNRLTTPEAYLDHRGPELRIRASLGEEILQDRFLSLSQLFFDPGDGAEIATIYTDSLDAEGLYDYTIAIKLKEIIAPNFPMVYQISAVDGFDGGVLPLASYSNFMAETLLAGERTTDGRLREFLESVPDDAWLDRLNVRYLITDKVGDVWINGVFFDRQISTPISAGESVTIGHIPTFAADGLQIIFENAGDPAEIEMIAEVNGEPYQLLPLEVDEPWRGSVWQTEFARQQPESIRVVIARGSGTIGGSSLVNRDKDSFVALAPGAYKQIYSGDVKVYENLDVWPRAYLLPAETDSLDFAQPLYEDVDVIKTDPESIVLATNLQEPAKLVLADAAYPGWRATINGTPAELDTFDQFFRSVELPAGVSEIVFEYDPVSFRRGRIISLVMLVVWIMGWGLWLLLENRSLSDQR